MPEQVAEQDVGPEGIPFESYEPEPPQNGSLEARMRARKEQLSKQQTEWFPIPGYESVLEVELRALPYETTRKVIAKLEKIRDPGLHDVYAMADQLLLATEGFREVNGEERRELEGYDWRAVAQLLPDPPELTPRQALIFVVGTQRIAFLVTDWGEWAKSGNQESDEEVVEGFAMTP